MSNKEATAIILDVSSSMSSDDVSLAVSSICRFIEQIITFGGARDEVALFLVGCDESKNILAENGDGYEHVSLIREFALADVDMLRLLQSMESVPRQSLGDIVDGLVVAMHTMTTKFKQLKYRRRFILFSNAAGAAEWASDDTEGVLSELRRMEAEVLVVGCDENMDSAVVESCLSVQLFLRSISQEMGSDYSFKEALVALSSFKVKQYQQRSAFQGSLCFGRKIHENGNEPLLIGVTGFTHTSEYKRDSFKRVVKCSYDGGETTSYERVNISTEFEALDEDGAPIDRNSLTKAYRYGKTLVPLSQDEEIEKEEKSFFVIGATPASTVQRHRYIDGCTEFSPRTGDRQAAIVMDALVRALIETDMVLIVRLVMRKSSVGSAKVGFVAPNADFINGHEVRSLLYTALPFKDDLRPISLPPLHGTQRTTPTADQEAAIEKLIYALDVGEGKTVPLHNMVNPQVQHFIMAIRDRAMNPGAPIAAPSPEIEALLEPPCSFNRTSTDEALASITTLFSLTERKKTKIAAHVADQVWGKAVKRVADDDNDMADTATKRLKTDEKMLTSVADLFGNSGGGSKKLVSSLNPVEEFLKIVFPDGESGDLADLSTVEDAIEQATAVISELVKCLDIGNDIIQCTKVIDVIAVVRRISVLSQFAGKYNAWLREFVGNLASLRRDHAVLLRLKNDHISLISVSDMEVNEGVASTEESILFLEGLLDNSINSATAASKVADDDDSDLEGMLD